MSQKVGGSRPRPRVALIGDFTPEDVERYNNLFPTIWLASSFEELETMVQPVEIDLIIIDKVVKDIRAWCTTVNIICFSPHLAWLPGPRSPTYLVKINGELETEGYSLPDLPLALNRRREMDFSKVENVKGWRKLTLKTYFSFVVDQGDLVEKAFKDSAVVIDPHTDLPLAVIYQRIDESHLGVAWLPNPAFDQVAWVELIVTQWAQSDRVRFPDFGNWTKSVEWMVPAEEELAARIGTLEEEKLRMLAKFAEEIGALTTRLAVVTLEANQGRRRLLSAQGDGLVDEVEKVFEEFGFQVQTVDDALDSSLPKREDLRLQDVDASWEAIVEVRGYAKSGGTTADMARLQRFANFYQKEKGYLPDKRIYVVNGMLELMPSQRQIPLASAKEDVELFAEDDGIVISTIDLFKASKLLKQWTPAAIRESIKRTKGRWTVQSIRDI